MKLSIFYRSFQCYIKWVFIAVLGFIVCDVTVVAEQQTEIQPANHTSRIAIANQFLDEIEPWILSKDFDGFIDRLTLSNDDLEKTSISWNYYEKQSFELKRVSADLFWDDWVSKIVEANRDLVSAFGIEETQRIIASSIKTSKQVIHKFTQLNEEFLGEFHGHITVEESTWNNAVLWLRRQRLLRGDVDYSWMDLNSLPDLIDQFDRFLLEDVEYSHLIELTSEESIATVESVHELLEDWARQTDLLVDSYLLNTFRTEHELKLASILPTKDWLVVWKGRRMRRFQKCYKLLWATSENIASVVEPVVGEWAAGRWRRATELTIFPESCPLNSFEILFSLIVDQRILSVDEETTSRQLLLPYNRKLARLRSSMIQAAEWYSVNLMPKRKGYDVPPFPIDSSEVERNYRKTIMSMIDILEDVLQDDLSKLSGEIQNSRDKNTVDRYWPSSRSLAIDEFGDEFN